MRRGSRRSWPLQLLVPQPIPDAAFANLWGTDLVEEVLTDLGRRPDD
jgi:hypothetical protein